jgi:hypothetical protein
MKRPVVASPYALGGLSARPGADVLCASAPEQWVARVGRLLDQSQYAARIARNGHRWVRRTHSWSLTGRRFYEILASVSQHPRQARSDGAGHSFLGEARLQKQLSARTPERQLTPCLSEPEQRVSVRVMSACGTRGGPAIN